MSPNQPTSNQPFGCSVCERRFTRHENLKRHAALHGPPRPGRAIACPLCETTFSRRDLQHRHMKRKHPELASAGASITRQVLQDVTVVSPEGTLPPHSPPDSRLDYESPEDPGRDWQACQTDDSAGARSRYEDEALLDNSPGGHSWSSHDGSLPMSSNQGSYEAPSGALLRYGVQHRARSD